MRETARKIFLLAVAEGGRGPRSASHYKIKFNDSGTIIYADRKNYITAFILNVLLLILLCRSIFFLAYL